MINPPFANYKMEKSDWFLTGILGGVLAGMYLMNVLSPCEDKVCTEEPSQTEEILIPEESCISGLLHLSGDSSEILSIKEECQRSDYWRAMRIKFTDDCTLVEVHEDSCAGYACEPMPGPRIRARFCKNSSVSLEHEVDEGWGAYQPEGE